jgi:threonine dehydratase
MTVHFNTNYDPTCVPADYLPRILTAQVYDIAVESPLTNASTLSIKTNNKILLKREDLQPVFSFKLRGAFNKLKSLSPEQRSKGVIACSAGNHAQGTLQNCIPYINTM